MIGKRLINTGVAAADALVPSENFNTVLYTGNGSTQRIGGYINRGAEFNGSSSNIVASVPNSVIDTIDSVSFWFNLNSLSSVNSLLNIGNLTSNGSPLRFRVSSTGATPSQKLRLIVHNSSNTVESVYSTTTISANTWYHVVAVWTGSQWKMYLNGVNEANSSSTTSRVSSAGNEIYIGENDALYNPLNGKLDQVRIFNKALSSSEVTTLYGETHASTTISTTDIFSDNSGVALYQLDGNANDTGGVNGKFGSAAIFNGSNADIDLPSGMQSSTMTVSLWMYLNATETGSIVYEFSNGYGMHFLNTGTAGKIASQYANSNSSHVQSNSVISSGQWVHIVGVHTSSSSKLYVDGVQQSGAALTDFYTCDQNTIGSRRSGEFFEGRLDDIRIYSDELTSTEVGYIYNNTTASIPTDNLVAYYKLDGDARDEQQLYDGVATNVSYAYDGTATNVTYQEATNFQPDLVWIKSRSYANNHFLYDSVRGTTKAIYIQAESEIIRSGVTSFDTNGFTLGTSADMNTSNATYVAWCFNAGDGAASSVSNGTNTSSITQKANQDGGFSITKFSGTSTATGNFPHGLSSTPEMVIVKTTSDADSWFVWHKDLTSAAYALRLNTSAAESSNTAFWNSTAPDATNVTLGGGILVSGWDYVSYCFHSVDGYSKVGSYTGNGSSSGPIVETGFEPAWIMIKRTDSAEDWKIIDNKRDNFADSLEANESIAEENNNNSNFLPTSNGFQINDTSGDYNASGGTYIYLAIAADPDTTTPTVENSFDVVTYTGNGSSQDIETDFKPDLVWVKNRTGTAYDHKIADSVRGATKIIESSTTDAEITATGSINAFNTNGFTIGTDNSVNGNGNNFVAWCWKAGDHDDNLPQINTEGSIDSVVSVNAEAGFSIVKYTGTLTSSGNISVGHGLSAAPELIISKRTDSTGPWRIRPFFLNNNAYDYLEFDTDALGQFSSGDGAMAVPTSTTFDNNWNTALGGAGDVIAYCFHSVSGYQKIGSYSGNGTDLSITGLGFQPRFLMLKRTDSTGNWVVFDNVRGEDEELYPNLSNAESNEPNRTSLDSDGFTVRSGRYNNSGSTFIYLAIK